MYLMTTELRDAGYQQQLFSRQEVTVSRLQAPPDGGPFSGHVSGVKGAVGRIVKIQDNLNIDIFSVPPPFLLKPKMVS